MQTENEQKTIIKAGQYRGLRVDHFKMSIRNYFTRKRLPTFKVLRSEMPFRRVIFETVVL